MGLKETEYDEACRDYADCVNCIDEMFNTSDLKRMGVLYAVAQKRLEYIFCYNRDRLQ